MKRVLVVTLLAALPALLEAAVPTVFTVENYAKQLLPDCAGRVVKTRPVPGPAPAGFLVWEVEQAGPDPQCKMRSTVLVSPATEQTLAGDIFPLPLDSRPVEKRIEELASRVLKSPVKVLVERDVIPDGLRSVTITKLAGPRSFPYHGYVDRDLRFLMIATRGNLKSPPGITLLQGIGLDAAVSRGAKKGKVQIVELSDLQCPTCKRAHDALEPIVAKNLSRISYSRIDLPLFEHHDWSLHAALGARAIARVAPARYWDYVDYIFANQSTITKQSVDQMVKDFCEDHDLDWTRVEPIYRSPGERRALIDQVGRAFDRGIFSTPTFFINGRRVAYGHDGANLIAAVNAELAKAKGK